MQTAPLPVTYPDGHFAEPDADADQPKPDADQSQSYTDRACVYHQRHGRHLRPVQLPAYPHVERV
jgi:hypothetical protein